MSVDAASALLGLAMFSAFDEQQWEGALPVLGGLSLGGYVVGGPVTHFVQDEPVRGLGSFGLRVALPFVFGAAAVRLELDDSCSRQPRDFCGLEGPLIGGLVGMATAAVVDAAALGWKEAPVEGSGPVSLGASIGPDHAALLAGGRF